ncbi:hypothetical protein ABK040_007776 [Willaertia magna]
MLKHVLHKTPLVRLKSNFKSIPLFSTNNNNNNTIKLNSHYKNNNTSSNAFHSDINILNYFNNFNINKRSYHFSISSSSLHHHNQHFLEEFKKHLNQEQYEAVTYDYLSPLCVYSGPGSGKTKVITYKIAYLIKYFNLNPENIFAMTFTNKAAKEMKSRISHLLKDNSLNFEYVGTFHSICTLILRKFGDYLEGFSSNFTIMDESDKNYLIKKIMKFTTNEKILEYFEENKDIEISDIIYEMSKAKKNLNDSNNNTVNNRRNVIGEIIEEYEEYKKLNKLLDFDDILVYAYKLLSENERIAKYYSNKCHALLVDEFQDTDSLQYKIIKYLCNDRRNLFVVGDADQNIYSWRFSDASIMNHTIFKEFPNMKTIYLSQNYRSTKSIINVSKLIISENKLRKHQEFKTNNMRGLPVCLINEETGDREAFIIGDEILKLIAASNGKLKFSDFAVLIRANHYSQVFEKTFSQLGINYHLVGLFKFYDRKEIKDILSYCRLIDNTNDNVAFERCISTPRRGFGEKTLLNIANTAKEKNISSFELVKRIANEEYTLKGVYPKKCKEFVDCILELKALDVPPSQLINEITTRIGYEEYLRQSTTNEDEISNRMENINELSHAIYTYELEAKIDEEAMEKERATTILLREFLRSISLVQENPSEDKQKDSVTISTIHSAKGLEFGVVFVPAVESGNIPYSRAKNHQEIEEERRILYVACTRAKSLLYLSYANSRYKFGSNATCTPSNFLKPLENASEVTKKSISKLLETQGVLYRGLFEKTVDLITKTR